HRLNMDVLRHKGSGFVASHGPDFLLANDAWARFINMRYGPDGNVYLIDWYDKQACHHGDVNIWDRSNGRIYKISYRGTKPKKGGPKKGSDPLNSRGQTPFSDKPVRVDLGKKSDQELVGLLLHKNEWYVRHARQLLQERFHSQTLDWKGVN